MKSLEAALNPSGGDPRGLVSGPQRAFPYTQAPELRSTGTVETVTVLIDFKDVEAAMALPGMTAQTIGENIYGRATPIGQSQAPFDSVRNYYFRASEEQLEIEGETLGWVRMEKNRSKYEPQYPPGASDQQKIILDNDALFRLITGALDSLDASTDFSRFDNDNDGDVDLLTVMYAGAPAGWGSFWWAYRWEFFLQHHANKRYDGKRLRQFVFQFIDPRSGTSDFHPQTLIHEFGHALGLPDYYDYCSKAQFQQLRCPGWVTDAGPDGGVGKLDIMDGNWGNHNAFSRWLLDWVQPQVVARRTSVELRPSTGPPGDSKAGAIFPGLQQTDTPGQELFLIEHRRADRERRRDSPPARRRCGHLARRRDTEPRVHGLSLRQLVHRPEADPVGACLVRGRLCGQRAGRRRRLLRNGLGVRPTVLGCIRFHDGRRDQGHPDRDRRRDGRRGLRRPASPGRGRRRDARRAQLPLARRSRRGNTRRDPGRARRAMGDTRRRGRYTWRARRTR